MQGTALVESSHEQLLSAANWTPGMQAVYSYMRVCDTRGTDVRLSPMQFYRPHAWPRASVDMTQWMWQTVQEYPWGHCQHINILELRALFNYLRFRSRRHDLWSTRFLMIVDSQVVASVVAKGRSSSLKLNVLLRRVAALLLVSGTRIFIAWCRSEANPADAPSRRKW